MLCSTCFRSLCHWCTILIRDVWKDDGESHKAIDKKIRVVRADIPRLESKEKYSAVLRGQQRGRAKGKGKGRGKGKGGRGYTTETMLEGYVVQESAFNPKGKGTGGTGKGKGNYEKIDGPCFN